MESDDDRLTLEILERLAASPGYSATVTEAEFHLFEGLEASGYISGKIGPDTHDAPDTMVERVKLTATGRQHLRELRQELSKAGAADNNGPTANSVLTSFAAGVLAECYTGNELVRLTRAWALDCNIESLPFVSTPIPAPTTKREALEKNLLAFHPAERLRVIEDMVAKAPLAKAATVTDLSNRLKSLRGLTPPAPAVPPKEPISPGGPSELFATKLSGPTYELLDTIWDYYAERYEWPTTWFVHSRLGKPRVVAARTELTGDHLIENTSGQGSIYQLLICGLLLTRQGKKIERLLVRYIDYLRDRYAQAPMERTVTSADVGARLSLSETDLRLLGELINIAGLFGSGSRGPTEWTATIPTEIEDCLPDMSSRDFLRQALEKRRTPNLPIALEARQRQLFASQPEFPMSAAPFSESKERLYQVFVSSTFTDLKDERHEVMMALLQTKCIPVGMERFPATDVDQMAYIRPVIDNCDYYIVILAGRYGTVPDGKSVSYTEMEFDYAVSKGKHVIVMCHHDVGKLSLDMSEKSDLGRQRLQTFYDKVRKGRICDHWSSAHELASKVKTAIYDAIENHPQPGWVRASTIASAAERKAPSAPTSSPRPPSGTAAKIIGIPVRFSYRPKDNQASGQVQTVEFETKRTVDELLLHLARRLEKPATASSLKGSFERSMLSSLATEVAAQNGGTAIDPYSCSIKIAPFQRVIDALNAEDLIQWKAAPRGEQDQSSRWVISRTGVKRLSRLRANGETSPE